MSEQPDSEATSTAAEPRAVNQPPPAAAPAGPAVVAERAAVAQQRAKRELELSREAAELQRSDDRLARGRALGFIALITLLGMALYAHQPWSWPAAAAALLLFLILVVLHAQVATRQTDVRHRQQLINQSLERIEDRYHAAADDAFRRGDAFLDPEHPYAGDLDIFGRASLFEQINATHTQHGAELLAKWLAGPASVQEVLSRQRAARELAGNWRLREDLALVAARASKIPTDGAAFLSWAAGTPSYARGPGRWLALAALVAAVGTSGLGVMAFGPGGNWVKWWLGAAFAQLFVSMVLLRGRTEPVVAPVMVKQSPLERYLGMLELVETASFEEPRLKALQARLMRAGAASQRLRSLDRWTGLAAVRHNVLGYMMVQALVMWDVWVAYRLDAWRAAHGGQVADWLMALAEVEALASLGGYADEHPEFCWPELVEGAPCYQATSLGHPLIAANQRVDNDLWLDDEVRALMISGSNMSGKSTMLRSIGINAVLAQAGGPVRASKLRMSPARVHTSMRVGDALDQGASHFFMEVRKLKEVVDAVAARPNAPRVLFLLDEVLHGTNSRERNIGAKAVVQHLVERGAIGAVSSHDLGLAELERLTAGKVINKHFEDHIEGGSMVFDYRIKDGPVASSNALRLMRAVGIAVAGLEDERVFED